MNWSRRTFILFFFAMGLMAPLFWGSVAHAHSSYFTTYCTGCHSSATGATCNGCHHHGPVNLAGTTNKSSYTPGETVSVTITGGSQSGWFRAILYDQNNNQVAISNGNDSGMGHTTTYPAVLSAAAPTTPGTYTWKVAWFGNSYDSNNPSASSHGEVTANTNSFTVAAPADVTAPTVGTFTLPLTYSRLTVPVTAFTASDNVGVTGYLVTTSNTTPAAGATGWSSSAPTTVTASSEGVTTFYAWAKDAAGNVSSSASASVTITIPNKAASDFNYDGTSDVLLRDNTTGAWRLFSMGNMAQTGQANLVIWANQDWQTKAIADFDGDGDSDVLLRNMTDGSYRLFIIENGAVVSSEGVDALYRDLTWEFAGTGDLDGDGDADILLRDTNTGIVRAFYMNAGTVNSSAALGGLYHDLAWQVVKTGDLDGDGDDDILMRNTTTGAWRAFYMQGGSVVGSANFNAWRDLTWSFQGLADYDGDGDADLLLRDVNGFWQVFQVQGGQVVSTSVVNAWKNPLWELQSADLDLNGDGVADLLLRNSQTGDWRTFTMQQLDVVANGSPNIWSNANWQFQ